MEDIWRIISGENLVCFVVIFDIAIPFFEVQIKSKKFVFII